MALLDNRWTIVSLLFSLAVAGCGGAPGGALPDLSITSPDLACASADCACATDRDCPTGRRCDAVARRCVTCLADADCPAGQRCHEGACAAGCTANHPCGAASVCEVDAGLCVQCVADRDCPVQHPRCSPDRNLCVDCLAQNDNCAAATYCDIQQAQPTCKPGCKSNLDCVPALDGGARDGGVPALCDTKAHRCVECLVDADCGLGALCQAGACVGGCGPNHGCPVGFACCGSACVDTNSDGANCGACSKACAVGKACCGGGCTTTDTDLKNCGGCGVVCGGPAATCKGGKCGCDACQLAYADCDNNCANGCETNILRGDPNNCGACRKVCALAHATADCSLGNCTIARCDAGWADCNTNSTDGCETAIATDTINCGQCGTVCPAANGTAQCVAGQCSCGCNVGFLDCDNNCANGCEVNSTLDISNCGGCGRVCAGANGAPQCAGGRCGVICSQGYADCNMNPGDGCEVHVAVDVMNCGSCGGVCRLPNAAQSCNSGVCGVLRCNAGYSDCDARPADGCEVQTAADVMNCGMCGVACMLANATPTCSGGACAVMGCNAGYADCNKTAGDGCEVHTDADVSNCGTCASACSIANATASCSVGVCGISTCTAGYADCNQMVADGCEIRTANDAMNCGSCSHVCFVANGSAGCASGACTVAACNAGFGDCNGLVADGCERPTAADLNNCGACGRVCTYANAGASCTGGTCAMGACNGGYADCNRSAADGCEVNTDTDSNNCGGCGVGCGVQGLCVGGTCHTGSCASPFFIPAGGGKLTGHMSGNSTTTGSCGSSAGVERFVTWTPAKSGTATVNSVTDYWPAVIYVRSGGCNGAEVACTSSGGPWPNMTITFPVTAGTTYYLVPDGFYNGAIIITFNLTVSVQ